MSFEKPPSPQADSPTSTHFAPISPNSSPMKQVLAQPPRSLSLSSTTDSFESRTSLGGDSPYQQRIGTAGLGIESRLNGMDLDMEPPLEPTSPLSPTTPLTGPWPASHSLSPFPAAESSSAAFARAVRAHGIGGFGQDVSIPLDSQRSVSAPESCHHGGAEEIEGGGDMIHGQGEHEEEHPHPPMFSRTVSAPLPSRIGYLRNPYSSPRRFGFSSPLSNQSSDDSVRSLPAILSTSASDKPPSYSPQPGQSKALQALSHELADSLQSAIQTLLHLSPPQLLDNAKEQYSGCSVQMPTTSVSALLTAMKGLNYLSANFKALCDEESKDDDHVIFHSQNGLRGSSPSPRQRSTDEYDCKLQPSSLRRPPSTHSFPPLPMPPQGILDDGFRSSEDFDIGELLQSTADLLGGQASQSGVDLVLFHGDVGIKHVSVRGDAGGLGYALSVILRQILSVCKPGDCLELGLQLTPQSPSQTPRVNAPMSAADLQSTQPLSRSSNADERSSTGRTSPGKTMPSHHDATDGPLLCTFEIVHNLCPNTVGSPGQTPKAEMPPFSRWRGDSERDEPDFSGLLCRRILKHVNASLRCGVVEESPQLVSAAESPLPRRSYELAILLARGQPIIEPIVLSPEEQAARQPFPSLRLSREPTLDELADFAESLRGKRVELHASLRSLFARHLTSYLAAWGMDISHTPIEDNGEEEVLAESFTKDTEGPTSRHDSGYGGSIGGRTPESEAQESSLRPNRDADNNSSSSDRIIIIDDDVSVLKKQLLKIRAESPITSFRTKMGKRPGLSSRAKSSPQVRQVQSSLGVSKPTQLVKAASSVVIHFTSLANYQHVRDVVSSILAISPDASIYQPEVMVIPKPVGPRRFLTALHTALDRPLVDPFFSPIATSPRSPGGGYFSTMPSRAPSAVDGVSASRFGTVQEESSEGEGGPSSSDEVGKNKSLRAEGTPARPAFSPGSRFSESGHLQIATPSGDMVATSALEYFSDAAAKMGSAAASGLVVQSPDGRPVGMYFDPPPRVDGRRGSLSRVDQRRRPSVNRTPVMEQGTFQPQPSVPSTSPTSRRQSSISMGSSHGNTESRRSSLLPEVHNEEETSHVSSRKPELKASNSNLRRKTMPTIVSTGNRNRDRAVTITDLRHNLSGLQIPSSTMEYPIDDGKPLPPTPGGTNEVTTPGSPFDVLPRLASRKAAAIQAKMAAKMKEEEEAAAAKAKAAMEAKPVPAPRKSAFKEGVVVPPINVLIVEDNPINQNILSMFLRKKKIKHQSANNGQEAVEKWKTGAFHLILMDIQLPVMSGIEATKEIRRLEKDSNIGVFPLTPSAEVVPVSPSQLNPVPPTPLRSSVIIVALTASSLQTDRVNALAAGCNDFLTKPVSLTWLENKIIEWGCMQALIDFDGWRRWKTSDAQGPKAVLDARRAFQTGSDAQARSVASRLRIDRIVKPPKSPITSSSETTTSSVVTARDSLPGSHHPAVPGANVPNIEIKKPKPENGAFEVSPAGSAGSEETGHTTLPEMSNDMVTGEKESGVDKLQKGLEQAEKEREDAMITPVSAGDLANVTPDVAVTPTQTPSAHQLDTNEPSSHSSGSTATATPHGLYPLATTLAPSPQQAMESISTDPETIAAPESDPVDSPHLHHRLPAAVMVDPETIGGGGADDGPQPNSEPSSGDSIPDFLTRKASTSKRSSGKEDKPLPPIPFT